MAHRGTGQPQDILRQGYLTKRSQTPSRFSTLTYQLRWFCLTKSSLAYFNSDSEKQREKGRLPIGSLKWVEKADLGGEPETRELRQTPLACLGFKTNQGNTHNAGFQVGYSVEPKKTRVLYLKALTVQDRDLWIQSLRQCLSRKLGLFSFAGLTGKLPFCEETHFHRGLLGTNNQKWNCCGASGRDAPGCEPITIPLHPATSQRFLSQSKLPPSRQGSLATLNSTTGGTLEQNKTIPPSTEEVGSRKHLPQDHSRENSIRSETDLNTLPPPMAGGTPGTPLKSREKEGGRRLVVALYPFKAIEPGDLSLEKGEEYEVVDDTQEHWWQVREKNGVMGYIPSNYVKEKELVGLQQWDWYVGDMSRQRAETLLRYDDKEGSFVVRNSSTKGLYTLSLYTKVPHPQVKHYHIKQNGRAEFFLSEKHCCPSIPDLVTYHRHNAGGLASRLKHPPITERTAPPTAGLSHDKWEIDPSELMLHEELGSGQFGVVRRGKWRGSIDVAVKMMKEGTMSEDDFIEEAKVMTKLQHQNLVQLYGVCSKHRPIYIVTEYMKHGALLNFLRRHETSLQTNLGMLLDISIQVCKGMAYLERHNYIHRDLAARNCLVGGENVVKVADFGLARYVLDDQYTSSGGTKFPIKWAPPEVLNYTRFSSKSDIWAYGVLMWEVFTCGKMPYGRLKNTEVVERVQRGIVLEKPKNCPKETYEVMKKCWSLHPDERPSFRALKEELLTVTQLLMVD